MMGARAGSTIFRVAGCARGRAEEAAGIAPAVFFVAGYLMVWIGFGGAAAFLQWVLDSRHLLSETMAIGSARVAGTWVIDVGLYQKTPLNHAALVHVSSADGAC